MPRPVSFTLDLEDLRPSPHLEVRVDKVTHQLLDRVAELGVRGTVFVVGDVARAHPDLVRRAARDGHEVALHGDRHVPLTALGPEAFRAETSAGRRTLEDLLDTPVQGYRAPMMSLVPDASWAPHLLGEMEFQYSSSVLGARNPLHGWPGLPPEPFRWSSGVVELPCPLVRLAGVALPFLGGTYLRLLPRWVRTYGLRQAPPGAVLWTYCHPWEFDPEERFYVFEHGGWLVSRIAWLNRRAMLRRLEDLLREPAGLPLGEVSSALVASGELPTVDPAAAATAISGRERPAAR